jgi:hypothetical protein
MEQEHRPTVPHIKNKHTDDLIDHYWGTINYVSNLIRASEIKAGLILSFYGILLNLVFQNIQMLETIEVNKIVIYILLALWFCCTVGSIYFSVRCFIPRIEGKYDKNIFFFKDVISKFGTIDQFSNSFFEVSLDEDRIFTQLGHQIYINSKIATMKFEDVNRSIRLLAISIFLLLAVVAYFGILII